MLRWLAVLAIFLSVVVAGSVSPQADAASPGDRFGMVFINGVEEAVGRTGTVNDWYARARDAGAKWNRWPIYWHRIETSRGHFDYTYGYPADNVVDADVRNGFKTNAILLGTPSWARVSAASVGYPFDVSRKTLTPDMVRVFADGSPAAVPPGLDEPVFINGQINPNNTYAYFVYNTVQRYKPGGILAQQRGWAPGQGVTVWEIWNEPDLAHFWQGTADDYYKLLRAGYQAVKAADPSATVLMAGLAYWSQPDFLGQVLNRLAADPQARISNFYFDALALHFYTNVRDVYDKTQWARQEMAARGISKPIWMNETNLPIYGDTTGINFGPYRGTVEQQASFVIQAMAYSLAADIERLFIFQSYEDGEPAFGLIRQNGTPRPAWEAYRLGATYLQDAIFESRQVVNGAEIIRANSPSRGRVTVAWNTGTSPVSIAIPAAHGSATLFERTGASRVIAATDGSYHITLNAGVDYQQDGITWHIDGDPVIIVEGGGSGPTATPTPVPTTPIVTISSRILGISPWSPPEPFEVRWARTDTMGGDGRFDVQYRTDQQSTWQYWITDSTSTSATFGQDGKPIPVEPGRTYYLRVRVRLGAITEPWPVSEQGDAFTITITPTNEIHLPVLRWGTGQY